MYRSGGDSVDSGICFFRNYEKAQEKKPQKAQKISTEMDVEKNIRKGRNPLTNAEIFYYNISVCKKL